MGQYTTRVIIGFVIINIILAVGIGLLLYGMLGSFTGEFFGGLGPGLLGLLFIAVGGLADIIYLIFVLVRKSNNK